MSWRFDSWSFPCLGYGDSFRCIACGPGVFGLFCPVVAMISLGVADRADENERYVMRESSLDQSPATD